MRVWIGLGIALFAAPRAAAQPTAPEAPPPSSEPAADEQPSLLEPIPRGKAPLIMATGELTPRPSERVWTRPPPRAWHHGAALGVGFGAAFVEDLDPGYFGRVDTGAYDIQTRRRGFIRGTLMGIEGWRSKTAHNEVAWGGSLPVIFFAGVQSDALFVVLGAGFDLLLVDRVEHDTGLGFFGPEAAADLGFDLEGVRFLVDGRAGYHWQLFAADRSTLRLGGVIQLTTD